MSVEVQVSISTIIPVVPRNRKLEKRIADLWAGPDIVDHKRALSVESPFRDDDSDVGKIPGEHPGHEIAG